MPDLAQSSKSRENILAEIENILEMTINQELRKELDQLLMQYGGSYKLFAFLGIMKKIKQSDKIGGEKMNECCKISLEDHITEKDKHFWKFLFLVEGSVILFLVGLFSLMNMM